MAKRKCRKGCRLVTVKSKAKKGKSQTPYAKCMRSQKKKEMKSGLDAKSAYVQATYTCASKAKGKKKQGPRGGSKNMWLPENWL